MANISAFINTSINKLPLTISPQLVALLHFSVFQYHAICLLSHQVQIIPWALCDGNSIRCPSPKLDPSRTVFVGGLHGLINADALAHIMDDLFGGVVYAGIDTDKYKYPIGKSIPSLLALENHMISVSF